MNNLSLLEKNINEIEQCLGDFKEKYEKVNKKTTQVVEVIKAKDNTSVLRICLDDEKKVCLSSLYQSNIENERWINQIEIKKSQVYIIFGLSNGNQIRELLKKIDDDSRIIVYEPKLEIFLKAIEEIDYTDIFSSMQCVLVVNGINQIQFSDIFAELVTWSNREAVQCISSVRYQELFIEEYKEFLMWIHCAQEKILIDRNTQIFFADASLDAILSNLKYLYKSTSIVDLEQRIEKDCIGIVVSSGPSLKKNIKTLREAKGKAFILACDSAVKYLLEEEIVPDALVTVDTLKKFDFPKIKGLHIPSFVTLNCSKEIIKEVDGTRIFYSCLDGYYESICAEMNKPYYCVGTGGSVACNAFDILRYMGCKTIVLVGQDLAFTNDELYPGQKRSESEGYQNRNMEQVEDVYGNLVYSDRVFAKYRRWFETEIEYYEEDIQVIDATEGGAKIKGSKIMLLKEVIDQYCNKEYNFSTMFQNLPIHFDGIEAEKYTQLLLKGRERIKKLEKHINRAINICERFVTLVKREYHDEKEMKKIVKELGDIVKKIEDIPEEDILNLYVSAARYYATTQLGKKEETIEKEQRIVAERNIMLYKSMKGSIKYLKDKYDSMLKEISI